MRRSIFISMLVLLSVLLAGCGSASTPDGGSGNVSSQEVNIAVSTNPDPATMGDIELVLTITDADGTSIEGARVDVSANHTDMTGMTMSGPATDQGSGRYAITANFSMSGNWKLTVYVRSNGLDYQEDIQFKIQ
jgi:uncharacterized protein YceK